MQTKNYMGMDYSVIRMIIFVELNNEDLVSPYLLNLLRYYGGPDLYRIIL